MIKIARKFSLYLFLQIFLVCTLQSSEPLPIFDTVNEEAYSHYSDSLIIKKGDEVLYSMCSKDEWEPIAAWSITKSFISMGIGFLYDEGKINIDQPLSDFLPGWSDGVRAKVTIRHLLNHTSGIDPTILFDDSLEFLKDDSISKATMQEITDEPGTTFYYNNHAVNLLSGVIEKISGKRADIYIEENLFVPLNITKYTWDIDEAGHALGMCGLHIRADDLIKLGELMLHKGMWEGKRVISEKWIEESISLSTVIDHPKFAQFDGCGLLWWLSSDEPEFYTAAGFLGQYCVVFPESGIVAVRQHDYRQHQSIHSFPQECYFRSFFELIRKVVSEVPIDTQKA